MYMCVLSFYVIIIIGVCECKRASLNVKQYPRETQCYRSLAEIFDSA